MAGFTSEYLAGFNRNPQAASSNPAAPIENFITRPFPVRFRTHYERDIHALKGLPAFPEPPNCAHTPVPPS
ncbi:MAG: hypothetical protein B7X09_02775 [Acidiphilium sp. 21-66-27]|nr:MAG: hypothetical protein B7X09_02775 [Acidiphilium sp. 21-66-27]